MPDVRRALPATPIAALAGLCATAASFEDTPEAWLPLTVGPAALVTVFSLAYGLFASWPDHARRLVGYLATIVLALVVATLLAILALATALCGGGADRCNNDTLAAILALAAVVAPLALVTLYITADRRTLPHP